MLQLYYSNHCQKVISLVYILLIHICNFNWDKSSHTSNNKYTVTIIAAHNIHTFLMQTSVETVYICHNYLECVE